MADEQSRVIRGRSYRWDGVPVHEYKTEGTHFHAITRQTLLGGPEDERPLGFETRYFEVAPGGYSSLETHQHPHSVVVIRGSGEVVLDERVAAIEPFDCVYVAPGSFHQFHATGSEPLGFLCMVDRERDRPRLPDEDELARLREHPEVARRIKT